MSAVARVKAWRKARAERIKERVERDPLTQWLTHLPPVDRRAVPARRKRKVA